jgi:hypothetical protein
MKPYRVAGWLCALGLYLADAGATQAAWNNVFQVCCAHCRKPAVASYYAAPVAVAAPAADPCCPQPQCTTRYTMRCYYQPVTTYQTRTYYEPVTTYKTSYYCEPVTSYRYCCYFDPCSCSYQKVAVPTTSYVMRSQCCPVQSWVQRCCSVPVTTYQKSCYWEPTTCCTGPLIPINPCAQPVAPPPVANPPAGPSAVPPVVDDSGKPPARPPAVHGERDGNPEDRYYPPSDYMPPASYRQLPPGPQKAPSAPPVQPDPRIRIDRIVAAPATRVEGQVVRNDNAPRANARLRFVSNNGRGIQYPVQANSAGRFRVTLTSGSWLVYVNTADGREVLHTRLDVNGEGTRRVTLVSR